MSFSKAGNFSVPGVQPEPHEEIQAALWQPDKANKANFLFGSLAGVFSLVFDFDLQNHFTKSLYRQGVLQTCNTLRALLTHMAAGC